MNSSIVLATNSSDAGTPLRATLLVGLGGAVIVGLASYVAQWRAGADQSRREQQRIDRERAHWQEQEDARLQGLLFETKRELYSRVLRLASERRRLLVNLVDKDDQQELLPRIAEDRTQWYEEWREAGAEVGLVEPVLTGRLDALFHALRDWQEERGPDFRINAMDHLKTIGDAHASLRKRMQDSIGITGTLMTEYSNQR